MFAQEMELSFMMILLVADFVTPPLRVGTISARSDRRAMRERGLCSGAAFKVENERFQMAFAVYGVDANRCHCQVIPGQ